MQKIDIADAGLALSRIAFGTASLHHLALRRERARLLGAVLDAGITHFDTSPYYGDGIGEAALASLRGDVTIATKVGLYPRGGAHDSRTRMLMRKALGRLVPVLSRPLVDFSVASARRSLSESLARLGRERVDLLLLHEPRFDLVATDEWQRWLESESDRVGVVGIAGEAHHLLPFVRASSALARVLQTRDSLSAGEAADLRRAGRPPQITYGHLGGCAPGSSAADTLRKTAAAHPDTVLLVSTRRIERIAQLISATRADAPLVPQPA